MTKPKHQFLLKALCSLKWAYLWMRIYICFWLYPKQYDSRKVLIPFWFPAK